MSQPNSDRIDSDPLLKFYSEPDASIPAATQPVQPSALTEVAPVGLVPDESVAALRVRVETLEQALTGATNEVAALRSQVATLVSAVRDNKRTNTQRSRTAPARIKQPSPYRTLFASAGLVVGLALASLLWTYTTMPGPQVIHAAPAPDPMVPATPLVTEPNTSPAQQAPKPDPVAAPTTAKTAHVKSQEEPRTPARRLDYVGTLSIDASPDGEVFIDRQAVGRTPLRLENLKAGAHLVWIERDAYRRWTRVVEVPADKVSRISADLELIASR